MKKSNITRAFSLMQDTDFKKLAKNNFKKIAEEVPEDWNNIDINAGPREMGTDESNDDYTFWESKMLEDWHEIANAPAPLIDRLVKALLPIIEGLAARREVDMQAGEHASKLRSAMMERWDKLKKELPPEKLSIIKNDFSKLGKSIKSILETNEMSESGDTAMLNSPEETESYAPKTEPTTPNRMFPEESAKLPNEATPRFTGDSPVANEGLDDYGLGQNWKFQSSKSIKRNS